LLFRLNTAVLTIVVFAVVVGFTLIGVVLGRRLRDRGEDLHESLGVVQGALLGLVALVLAFGLTMAVGRYEARRSAVVDESNAISTTYLRAQMLPEPVRSKSMQLLRQYTDTRIALSETVPGSGPFRRDAAAGGVIQRKLWGLAGDAMNANPSTNPPRLYVESLNTMINASGTRLGALANLIPTPILFLQIGLSALAFCMLATYLTMLGRAVFPAVLGAVIVSVMLLLILDLDRPHRGFITVPDSSLTVVRASMNLPPAAAAPAPPSR
jgi:hypothetical protein